MVVDPSHLYVYINRNQSNSLELFEIVKIFSTLYILEGVDKDKAVGEIIFFSSKTINKIISEKAVKTFRYLDINGNGEISLGEFIKTCSADRALLEDLCQNYWSF